MTRSIQNDSVSTRDVSRALEIDPGVLNSVKDAYPSTCLEAVQSVDKPKWEETIQGDIQALESNQVWKVVVTSFDAKKFLHTIWFYKTKRDVDRNYERCKARLVACANEQLFGLDDNVTFADGMAM